MKLTPFELEAVSMCDSLMSGRADDTWAVRRCTIDGKPSVAIVEHVDPDDKTGIPRFVAVLPTMQIDLGKDD